MTTPIDNPDERPCFGCEPCGWLDVGMTPASRAQAERAGIQLPDDLLQDMVP